MTDRSEFEEDEYEGPLYRELGATSPNLWTIGQVLEGHLGFDAALFVANSFWSVVNRPAAKGVRLAQARYGLSPMVRRLRGKTGAPLKLPDFTLNLFAQAKRPFVFRDPPQKARDRGYRDGSLFFDVTPHQQVILENLAAHLGPRADVTYACAAFLKRTKLYALQRKGQVTPNSTFPPARALKGCAFRAS